tara:strand:+ start:21 stop:2852 length:2832 start_codon:yes stop_codon:yes gene_type:complete
MSKKITISFRDTNLFSGSSDTLRTSLGGGYYDVATTDSGQTVNFVDINPPTVPGTTSDDYIVYKRRDVDESSAFKHVQMRKAYADVPIIVPIREDIVSYNRKYPIRLAGNSNKIQDDTQWRSLLIGGVHKGVAYPGIFTEKEFADYAFTYEAPYSRRSAKLISTEDIDQIIDINYKYKFYLPLYENFISTKSELLIPNGYMMSTFSDSDDETTTFEHDTDEYPAGVENYVWDFITLERKIDPNPLLDTTYSDDPTKGGSFTPYTDDSGEFFENPSELELPSKNLNEYLTSSLLTNRLSSETEGQITYALQNIFFDEKANERYIKSNPFPRGNKFPFYVEISFPTDNGRNTIVTKADRMSDPEMLTTFDAGTNPEQRKKALPLTETIINGDFSRKFLKVLKETFVDNVPEVPIYNHEFIKTTEYFSGSASNVDTLLEQSANSYLRCCEFSDLMLYAYRDYTSFNNNLYFVGDKTKLNDVVKDGLGVYRYLNTDNSLLLLKKYLHTLREDYTERTGTDLIDYVNFCNSAQDPKSNETIAYRIQKIASNPAAADASRAALQNFFFINSKELDTQFGGRGIHFTDTQVKYGEDYTYIVYAYVAVTGYRYKVDNLKISRIIGTTLTDEGEHDRYCIEFFDPLSNEAKGSDFQINDDMGNEFRTSAQIKDYNQFLADCSFNVQPSVRIKEIPIFAKKIRVQDNPATILDVSPFQVMDDSQRIGFFINYETQLESAYPKIILESDAQQKESYLSSNDLLENEVVTPEPISRIRYFQVFRTETRPTSYRDFADKLHQTVDLKIENTKQTYSSENFYDKIKTNQKYYYLFRAITEQNTFGHVSEVYAAELVDDGGYKYAVFNTLYEEDLSEDIYINTSKNIKKLIHIQPNLSQIALDTENIDFNKDAYSQLRNLNIGTAESLIWGKTFKLRLTSKKTSKKIDLNITYNLNSE